MGNRFRLGGHLHISAQRHPCIFAFLYGPIFHRQYPSSDVLLQFIARKRAEMPAIFLDIITGDAFLYGLRALVQVDYRHFDLIVLMNPLKLQTVARGCIC